MEDVDAIIRAARHLRLNRPADVALNRVSSLRESKENLKASIRDRMRFLAASYVSLATFINDEDVDFISSEDAGNEKQRLAKISRIYKGVLSEMDRLRDEIGEFDFFDGS